MTESNSHADEPIKRIIAAGTPVVYVETWEEERLLGMLNEASKMLYGDEREVWEWSAAVGFKSGPGKDMNLTNPMDALTFLIKQEEEAICLLKDLPVHFENNLALVRAVRDVYDTYSGRKGSVVMCHPWNVVPSQLGKEIYLHELALPEAGELLELLRGMRAEHPAGADLDDELLGRMAAGMHGLSLNEARDLFRKMLSEPHWDVEAVLTEINMAKAQLLMKEACLEVVTQKYDIDHIGGLEKLKAWVVSRQPLFSKEAQEANIKTPAGVLMMGVSGCGKSLAAKTIPTVWNLPCIRLDMNKIMSGGWGSPEVAWERAIRAAENAAPVVLWIDEIENSFGFLNDSATSGNMTIFSSFLTWMQEKPPNVFVAATANRIEILPPEMIRKGRFDQLFFVDLPEVPARMEILRIHIKDQGGNPEDYDLEHLAGLVKGWTAAEIEQMVKAARIDAFTDNRDFTYDDIIHNIYRIVPLSKTMSEQLNALRIWSHSRATRAD
jgi:ATP-dependent 26S proteasome regulatory subunit